METTLVRESTIPVQTPVTSGNSSTSGTTSTGSTTATVTSTTSTDDEFATFMKKALGKDSNSEVSEEELYAGLLERGLQQESSDAADAFRTAKTFYMQELRRGDGYVCVEEVAKASIQAVVKAGKITKDKAELINGEAFAGAQLDDNKEKLYDNRGGPGDPTKAVATLEQALFGARTIFVKSSTQTLSGSTTTTTKAEPKALDYDSSTGSGSKFPTADSLEGLLPPGFTDVLGEDTSSSGTTTEKSSTTSTESSAASTSTSAALPSSTGTVTKVSTGPAGFSWTPEDSSGHVSLILPHALAGLLDRVEIYSDLPASPSLKLEEALYSGADSNGNLRYSLSKSGASYGNNIYVLGLEKDGSAVSYSVMQPNKSISA